jgi:biotin carboxyl carrier protein
MQAFEAMPWDELDGEQIVVDERLITAHRAGVFNPVLDGRPEVRGTRVSAGQQIGIVTATGVPHPVQSAFDGVLMGLMALPGERVRKDQPLAWLIADPGTN